MSSLSAGVALCGSSSSHHNHDTDHHRHCLSLLLSLLFFFVFLSLWPVFCGLLWTSSKEFQITCFTSAWRQWSWQLWWWWWSSFHEENECTYTGSKYSMASPGQLWDCHLTFWAREYMWSRKIAQLQASHLPTLGRSGVRRSTLVYSLSQVRRFPMVASKRIDFTIGWHHTN